MDFFIIMLVPITSDMSGFWTFLLGILSVAESNVFFTRLLNLIFRYFDNLGPLLGLSGFDSTFELNGFNLSDGPLLRFMWF